MTALDTEPHSDSHAGVPPRRRRRRPAPNANLFFRFIFPLLVVAAAVVVLLLWREGTKAVLDTTDGREVPLVTDPAEPGFLAFATPTPTMLIAHVDDGDSLVGLTVLARTALDEGATLVILSADMLVGSGEEAVVLGPLYGAEGVVGLERVMGEFFGFGFTDDSMVMDPEALRAWLRLVEPIPFRLDDDLVDVVADGTTSVVIGAGGRAFDAETLAAVYGWRNPTEVDAARFTRQEAVWNAWLAQIAAADDPLAATLPFEDGLPAYLRALGTGDADVSLAPMAPFGFDPERPVYALAEADQDWPAEKALKMVPLPIAHRLGERPRVQVLDGTGDAANRDRMLPVLVGAGAEISVIGNASAFDVTETTVAYHQVRLEAVAVAFAAAIDAPVVFDDDPNQPVDLTVTIGTDVSDE